MLEEQGHSYESQPGQASYLVNHGRNTECKTDTLIRACEQPNTRPNASNDQKQTRVVGDHEPSAETQLRDWLQPLTEGLTW